jgi:hypothetical protein
LQALSNQKASGIVTALRIPAATLKPQCSVLVDGQTKLSGGDFTRGVFHLDREGRLRNRRGWCAAKYALRA